MCFAVVVDVSSWFQTGYPVHSPPGRPKIMALFHIVQVIILYGAACFHFLRKGGGAPPERRYLPTDRQHGLHVTSTILYNI